MYQQSHLHKETDHSISASVASESSAALQCGCTQKVRSLQLNCNLHTKNHMEQLSIQVHSERSVVGEGPHNNSNTQVQCVCNRLSGTVILNCPYMGTVMKACSHSPSLLQRMNDFMFWKEKRKQLARGADCSLHSALSLQSQHLHPHISYSGMLIFSYQFRSSLCVVIFVFIYSC